MKTLLFTNGILLTIILIIWLVPIDPVDFYVYDGAMIIDSDNQLGEIRKELVLKSTTYNIKSRLETINDSGYKFLIFNDYYTNFQLEKIDKTTIKEKHVRPDKGWVHILLTALIAIEFIIFFATCMSTADRGY